LVLFPLPLSSGPSVAHSSPSPLPSVWAGPRPRPSKAQRLPLPVSLPLPPTRGTWRRLRPLRRTFHVCVRQTGPPWPRTGVDEEKRTGNMLTTASHHPITPLLFSCAPQRVNAFREAGAETPPAPLTRPYLAPTSSEHERMWRRPAQRTDFSSRSSTCVEGRERKYPPAGKKRSRRRHRPRWLQIGVTGELSRQPPTLQAPLKSGARHLPHRIPPSSLSRAFSHFSTIRVHHRRHRIGARSSLSKALPLN
jgi:hypothetical protein